MYMIPLATMPSTTRTPADGEISSRQVYRPKPITDIFTSDTSIDRRKCARVVPMKVLVFGLGRTGTSCM
jgi:hypothetical protein